MERQATNGEKPTYESVEQFAQEVGISRQAAYKGLRNGAIPHIKLGWRVSSTLRHPAWEFTDLLPLSFDRVGPAC